MGLAATELWQQVTGTMPDEAARGLIIHFSLENVPDDGASDAEGRPVFKEVEFIEKRSPNDALSTIHRPATEADRREFPQIYRAWKTGAAEAISGTPLKEWAVIAKSQVEFLGFRGIRSVEQFAEVSDDGCHQMGQGYLTLRNKAQAWLAKAKDASQVTKMTAELERRDSKIRDLERQLSEIINRLDAKANERPDEPGQHRKAKQPNV